MRGDLVVDSSALLCILRREEEAGEFRRILTGSGRRFIAAPILVEAHMAARGRLGPPGPSALRQLIYLYRIEIVSFDEVHVRFALEACDRFGKGRGQNPACLNLGDCYSYALARARALPLLCKGEDFPQTDLTLALATARA